MKRFIIILFFIYSYTYSANIVKDVKNPILKVTFVDVGQGDGAVIQNLKNNKVVVVDTGKRDGKIAKYLDSQNIDKIDLLILTHPHSDHIGYAKKLILNYGVKKVLDAGFPHPSKMYERILKTIKKKNVPYFIARTDQTLNLGNGITLRMLAPKDPFLEGTRSDANTNSVVFILKLKDSKYYFAADSESETEEMILEDHDDIKVDILKVAHHGSKYATSDNFLDRANPKVAIISAGLGNSYGHPSEKVIKQLEDRDIKTYITFEDGTIETLTDGKGISVKSLGIKNKDSKPEMTKADLYTIAHNDLDNYKEMVKNGEPVLVRKHKPIILNGHFYADKNSDKFYSADCKKELNKIKTKNMIVFSSYKLAKDSGKVFVDCDQRREKKDSRSIYTKKDFMKLIMPTCRCQNIDNMCRINDNFERIIFYQNRKKDNISSEKISRNNGRININTASLFELTKLKGIGKGTARKIINYREKHGDFKHIGHIRRIKGIGNGKYKKIRDEITVGEIEKVEKKVKKSKTKKAKLKKVLKEEIETKEKKINVNTASIEELIVLPGIGEGTAQKIIDYRKKHGKFKHVGHIRRVKGIGNGKYKKIRDFITIE